MNEFEMKRGRVSCKMIRYKSLNVFAELKFEMKRERVVGE